MTNQGLTAQQLPHAIQEHVPNTPFGELRSAVETGKLHVKHFVENLSPPPLTVVRKIEEKFLENVVPSQTKQETKPYLRNKVKRIGNAPVLRKQVLPLREIDVWQIMGGNIPALIAFLNELRQKNEVPYFEMSLFEKGHVTSLRFSLRVMRTESDIELRVTGGKGRLYETFTKDCMLYLSEINFQRSPVEERREFVRSFMRELIADLNPNF